MKTELLIELLNELIGYNEKSLINYKADGNKEMEMYCNGKIDAYTTALDAISQLSACRFGNVRGWVQSLDNKEKENQMGKSIAMSCQSCNVWFPISQGVFNGSTLVCSLCACKANHPAGKALV